MYQIERKYLWGYKQKLTNYWVIFSRDKLYFKISKSDVKQFMQTTYEEPQKITTDKNIAVIANNILNFSNHITK